jgi:3,4-dihydroxy 2-butanone 4-phosphate synthase
MSTATITSTLAKTVLPTSDDQAVMRAEKALHAFQQGKLIVVQDDEDRENEADLIGSAEKISVTSMATMIRDGSGIVCLCLPAADAKMLGLRQMVEHNESRNGTAFTVSIEARDGVSTGVSAVDRVTTIRAALASTAEDNRIVSPGHVFPLAARDGGVLERRGHTESAVDLARLAGLRPAGVLCELMNPDGTMTRGAQVVEYARKNDLAVITVQDLVTYRQRMGC